jgi:leucyl-tRNA synthetase
MVFVNETTTWKQKPASVLADFLVLLQPFAPHLAEELWAKLRTHLSSQLSSSQLRTPNSNPAPLSEIPLAYQPWPVFDPTILAEHTLELPVQINGKLRDRITVPTGSTTTAIEAAALASPKIQSLLVGKTVKRIIVVPVKLVNIVVG